MVALSDSSVRSGVSTWMLSPAFTLASDAGGKWTFSAMPLAVTSTTPVLLSTDVTVAVMSCIPIMLSIFIPGMFMLLDVSATGLTGGQFMRALYASQRVSVMDGAAFGRASAGCVRVCFATDEATLDAACARLRHFCEQDRSVTADRYIGD